VDSEATDGGIFQHAYVMLWYHNLQPCLTVPEAGAEDQRQRPFTGGGLRQLATVSSLYRTLININIAHTNNIHPIPVPG
jgi:hypothetical protein